MNAAVQDAWPSSASSPQILAGGLTREVSAASSELSTVADAEAEIRRLTQVGLPILVPAVMGPYLSKTHLVIPASSRAIPLVTSIHNWHLG